MVRACAKGSVRACAERSNGRSPEKAEYIGRPVGPLAEFGRTTQFSIFV